VGGGRLLAKPHGFEGFPLVTNRGAVVVVMAFVSTTERALNTARLVEAAGA
jgi:hypothetical protein